MLAIEDAAPKVDAKARAAMAEQIMLRFCELWAGTTVYIPKNTLAKCDARDRAIFEAYDGKRETVRRLACEYGLTDIHVYRILQKERERRRKCRAQATPA